MINMFILSKCLCAKYHNNGMLILKKVYFDTKKADALTTPAFW
jgi:hypothetical protein